MTFGIDRRAWWAALLLVALVPATLLGQLRGVVVDQTGLPLPGAHVEVHRADRLVINLDTGLDGGFELPDVMPTDVVTVALDGFETVHIAPVDARRIVLPLAHATETTEVVASALTTAGASMEHLGSTMTAPLAQRLPTARPRILQSLPLLPGVVRGRDGQLNIGGTRPHESTLWIDGFDVTDPVRGITSLDLPVESVRGMAVLREPVSATFSDVLGSAASIETTPGGDQWRAGIQGFIPRPRLSQFGFGRIEAFFPRAYFGGRRGIARVFASTEFNFERVPVPGVTGSSGQPNIGTTGITSFARFDLQPSTRHSITLEGLFAPATTTDAALSTLRPAATSPDVKLRDLFGGVTDRLVLGSRDLLTIRVGANTHLTTLTEAGTGDPVLTPDGWQQNWFSAVDVSGGRETLSVSWDRAGLVARGAHAFSVNTDVHRRSMSGSLVDRDIHITDADGRLARLIQFGSTGSLGVSEIHGGVGVRDLWDVDKRLQLDLGIRLDGGGSSDTAVPGPRIGARYLLDDAGRTTVRGSAGRYVGRVPLAAAAFGQFPSRTTTTFDMSNGTPIHTVQYRPSVSPLPLPRADAVALELEHRFTPSLEAQAAVRERHGSQLPTVDVPSTGGLALLAGTGESQYYELQLSVRKTWPDDNQIFLSYVRSSSVGDYNDFGSMFTNLDAPLFEPGAPAPTAADVPHRFRGWGTFSLPRNAVVSPAIEWRSGFPYSVRNVFQHIMGDPNRERFPAYFSVDVTAFKTFDVLGRKMDLGLQLFNLTSHDNPRDVISVVDSPRYQEFANSFGITLAGYMQVRWQ
jgi:hypothetical protein